MAMSFSAAQLERFRREAKKFSRQFSISHSEALDRIAAQNGFTNWSLLSKHSEPAKSVRSAPPAAQPVLEAAAVDARERNYLHGDEIEGQPGRYFCRRCDFFVDAVHFGILGEHQDDEDGERYLAAIATWHRVRDEKTWLRRPDDAVNVVAEQAVAVRAAFEASRAPFHRWLEQQKGRNDPVGDLATDVMREKGFPVGLTTRRELETRLSRHGAHVVQAVRAAWREFEAAAAQSA